MTFERSFGHRITRRRFLSAGAIGTLLATPLMTACRTDARSMGTPTSEPTRAPVPTAVRTAVPTVSQRAVNPLLDRFADLNYLHTEGATIRDRRGRVVTLTGLNWFGMETETLAPHGIWARGYRDMLDQIVQLGYNCLRLPFSNELFDPRLQPNGIDFSLNPDLKGLNGLQILDRIITEAGQRGLKIILDQHRPTTDSQSPLWYSPELTTEEWIEQWVMLARRYLGNDAVIGADLHNEPSGDCTWGSGDPSTDWAMAVERCAREILAVNPYWLIIVEGIEKIVDAYGNVLDWTWQGGELMNARIRPITLDIPGRLVYSAHDYGPSVYHQGWFDDPRFPDNLPAFWDLHWGYLQKQGTAPILVGEFGGPSVGDDPDGKWQRALVSYIKSNRMHYTYWAFNANSADTGGLLLPDWKSVNTDKQALLKSYQGAPIPSVAPTVVHTEFVPPVGSHRLPLKALHFDNSGVQWTDTLKPELYVLNKTLDPLDVSRLEMRYWFAPNGDADPSAHAVEITGTTTQNFGQVLGPDRVRAEIASEPGLTYLGNPVLYVRITFAPGTLAPRRDSVGFGLRVRKKQGGQYFQPSHYSYRDYHWPSEWNRVGIYRDGQLIWGIDPRTFEETEAAKQRAIADRRAQLLAR
ncbi:MAG TPA: glycoside hydrolase family 5 protein [Chloroflexota bacterium]|nr:glycoside hydrolase family 5 protein [Chloroflexota bacterium]